MLSRNQGQIPSVSHGNEEEKAVESSTKEEPIYHGDRLDVKIKGQENNGSTNTCSQVTRNGEPGRRKFLKEVYATSRERCLGRKYSDRSTKTSKEECFNSRALFELCKELMEWYQDFLRGLAI